MKAISVKQPWAWAILNAGKDIENRSWKLPRSMLGETVAIHASAGCALWEYKSALYAIQRIAPSKSVPLRRDLPRGSIIGAARVVGCVTDSDSPWFFGYFGFVLAEQCKLKLPVPCKGFLGFWTVSDDVALKMEFRP